MSKELEAIVAEMRASAGDFDRWGRETIEAFSDRIEQALSNQSGEGWRPMSQCPMGVEVVALSFDGSVLVDAIRQSDDTIWWEHRFLDPDRFTGWKYENEYSLPSPPSDTKGE